MGDMQSWNGVDRRRSAIEVAEDAADTADGAKIDLANHVVECSARYNVLNGKVELQSKQLATQGKQLDKVVEAVDKIDDKLDSIIDKFNDRMDAKVAEIRREMDEVAKQGNERYSHALIAVISVLCAVIGWGVDHFNVFK